MYVCLLSVCVYVRACVAVEPEFVSVGEGGYQNKRLFAFVLVDNKQTVFLLSKMNKNSFTRRSGALSAFYFPVQVVRAHARWR